MLEAFEDDRRRAEKADTVRKIREKKRLEDLREVLGIASGAGRRMLAGLLKGLGLTENIYRGEPGRTGYRAAQAETAVALLGLIARADPAAAADIMLKTMEREDLIESDQS